MRARQFLAVAVVTLTVATVGPLPAHLAAKGTGAAALQGMVRSPEEGKMEGVLVTARRDGANFTTTVVSDAGGRYSFPRTHMGPGTYAVTIRAVGYDLASPGPVTVAAGKTKKVDLTLGKTKDLSAQLTSLDWAMVMPGTPEQKDKMLYQGKSCNYCHSFQRIARSKHTGEQFVSVIKRMNSYYPDGTSISDDGRGWGQRLLKFGDSYGRPTPNGPDEGRGDNWGAWPMRELGDYLATLNLSGGKTTWPYELTVTVPRPKGAATRVVITQWDQPRKVTESHDMDVDSRGSVWYGDESHPFIGKLDTRTNEFTEYALPPVPDGHLPGSRDVQVDKEDNVWFPMRVAGGASLLTKLEPATGTFTTVEGATGQFIALGPDGKMWMGGAVNPFHRIDMKTMKLEATYEGRGYQVVVSSLGNPYMSTRAPNGGGGLIVGFDVKANKAKTWPLPSTGSGRRGRMDAQDRYWFAEYGADKIGMFDTRTEKAQEWPLRKYFTPYAATVPDRDGHVWAPSNMSDRLARLNPKTGEVVEYLMPTELDTKKITFDPTAKGISLLMANMRNARILRVELLD